MIGGVKKIVKMLKSLNFLSFFSLLFHFLPVVEVSWEVLKITCVSPKLMSVAPITYVYPEAEENSALPPGCYVMFYKYYTITKFVYLPKICLHHSLQTCKESDTGVTHAMRVHASAMLLLQIWKSMAK